MVGNPHPDRRNAGSIGRIANVQLTRHSALRNDRECSWPMRFSEAIERIGRSHKTASVFCRRVEYGNGNTFWALL